MAPLRLRHLHLPSIHPDYVPYSLASRVQEHLRRQHLDFKDGSSPTRPPPPTLISFTPSPIYTLGRRQTAPLSAAEAARLTAPLHIPPPSSPTPTAASSPPNDGGVFITRPRLLHSPRGGLTTYHGPGQVVLWPVLDVKSPHHANFSVRCYARLLETTTMAMLRALFGIHAFTTDDPGVWVRQNPPQSPPAARGVDAEETTGGEGETLAKIAALGVHLRRHVTALGTAINVNMPEYQPQQQSGGEDDKAVNNNNPWARFIACGLEGRGVTSVAGQILPSSTSSSSPTVDGALGRAQKGAMERLVAGAWAEELARRLGLGGQEEGGGVEVVGEEEVVQLMEGLLSSGEGKEEEESAYVERMRDVLRSRR
ncbi:putative octanoyltransferase [Corynascus novoguineensis]|uniref:Octanoyltransferase n=1 Tax=Corynascus novoguineensis TaxID=1126955 RepID=A0AAN7CRI8_9PEZI|nr:putative octanoyltransferase [Corynascus novoguineensis]